MKAILQRPLVRPLLVVLGLALAWTAGTADVGLHI
jgi:hypothetical protein